MDRVKVLIWDKVSLVVPDKSDVEIFYKWINNINIQSSLVNFFWRLSSFENEYKFYEKINTDEKNITFSIYLNETKKVIWNIVLVNIDYKNNHCELWLWIYDNKYYNKWFWSESIELILKYIFEVISLNKIYLKYISINENLNSFYSRFWFNEVWRLQEHYYRYWKYYDEVYMELNKNKYLW